MLSQELEGLVMRCDKCGMAFLAENSETFKEAHQEAKNAGWLTRKINEEWYNFCCEECYHDRLNEQNAVIMQQQEDAVNPAKNPDWKCQTFINELNFIENDILKTLAKSLINQTPDYFFTVAASSTGKYHPKYTQGHGGLVRHTKAAVRIAVELLRIDMYSQLRQAKDYIIIALILHDSWKHGPITADGSYNEYTTFSHPKVAADFVRNSQLSSTEVLEYVASLIETHMGQWTTNFKTGSEELNTPQTAEQMFVHLCDYLASRKCLEFDGTIEYEG